VANPAAVVPSWALVRVSVSVLRAVHLQISRTLLLSNRVIRK
jgi:hypothetical protein